MITFLSGGTGTPKLIQGFRSIVDDSQIAVIANSADNIEMFGLYITPDIDTILYLFSDILDTTKMWGIKNETLETHTFLQKLTKTAWFMLGDKDLAVHMIRSKLWRKGESLSTITDYLTKLFSVSANIIPSTDNHIETRIQLKNGKDIHFQEFWVKHRGKVEIKDIYVKNLKKAKIPPRIDNILKKSEIIIIGPSNPITSIGPMLQIKELRRLLKKNKHKTIAISPIIGHAAISGPAAALMNAKGIEATALGTASYYKEFITKFYIDTKDTKKKKQIERETGLELGVHDIIFNAKEKTKSFAEIILKEYSK